MEKIFLVIQTTITAILSINLVHSNKFLRVTKLILIFQADCYYGARNAILKPFTGLSHKINK